MTVIRLLVLALAALAIGACSAESSSSPSSPTLKVVVDRQSVFVLGASTREQATPLADEACNEHDSVAVFHGFMRYKAYRLRTNSAWFECVPRIA